MFEKSNSFYAQALGSAGGSSRSSKKQAAARRNGRLGGRPPKRTLAEMLLNRPLNAGQRRELYERAREYMLVGNIQALEGFFHADGLYYSSDWRKPRGRVPIRVRHTIAQLKLVARFCLR